MRQTFLFGALLPAILLCSLVSPVQQDNTRDNPKPKSNLEMSAAVWHAGRPGAAQAKAGPCGEYAAQMVGEYPPNWFASHWFKWDRKTDGIELLVFINTADDHGVCIANLQKGDRIRVTNISGNCRFSRGEGVKKVISFLGVAGTIAAGILQPEAAPALGAGLKEVTDWANKNLVASNSGILRDGYGWDGGGPMNYCYNEGGVIICLPEAGGPLYGGGGEAAIRRADGDKTPRHDKYLPAHVRGKGFFPVRSDDNHNTRVIGKNGQMFILAWDGPDDFSDNTGYYVVYLQIVQPGRKFPGE